MTGRKQLAVGLFVLGITGVIAFGASRYLRKELFPVQVGSKAPNFTAVTLDSVPREKSLAEYRGQVVMINVWATWCLPCRVEMPSIEALHRDFGPKGLKVLAVSIDDPGTDETIRAFVKQYGLTFEVLHDPKGKISEIYDILGYPETLIVGKDGVIRKKLMSAVNWNSPESRALVQRLLAEPAA
jgi:cytochrome c biogenesis protein CcmG, thiol:disulfide interchange protein DsbE